MTKYFLIFSLTILSSSCVFPSIAKSENSIATKLTLNQAVYDQHLNKGFEILGVLLLDDVVANVPVFNELSGLEWDEDEKVLFAISDSGGLFHLKPIMEDNKLLDVELSASYSLKDNSKQPLSGKRKDSEGLALINHRNNIKNDTELLISFERKPRVVRFQTNGEYLKGETIAPVLQKKSNYQEKNQQLEAITHHPVFGLLTGPERPLVNDDDKIGIYSNNKLISKLSLADTKHGSLVGLSTLPDGDLIALERVYINVFAGLQFTLHHLKLNNDSFEQTSLLSITPADGFFNDNFEGITHHKASYFFMISDDNANAVQRSLLLYFRLPELVIRETPD